MSPADRASSSVLRANPANIPALEIKLGALAVLLSVTLLFGFIPLCIVRGAGRCSVDLADFVESRFWMSAMAEGCDVEYSLAEEQDFQQVLNICTRDDYSGLDYMGATFHRWLQEPGRLVFIAKMNKRVVALESALLVDGGQTVVFQGFRVAPDLRGGGVGGALHRHVSAHIRRHHPEVTAIRGSRGDHPLPQILAKYRLIAKEAILSLCCEAADLGLIVAHFRSRLSRQADSSSPCGPVTLNQQQAETLILTDHVISNLLPGKTIINDWEPLKPVEANLEVLRRRRLTWIADREFEPTVISARTAPYRVPYRHDALCIHINFFGRRVASVCAVFVAQLEALLPSLQGYLIFQLYVDPTVWPALHQFCLDHPKVSHFKNYQEELILETDF